MSVNATARTKTTKKIEPPTSVSDTSKLSKQEIDKFTYITKKLRPIDLDKYKMTKNKQMFNKNVADKSVCEKYKGTTQTIVRIMLEKKGSFLNLKSLNISFKNKIFKTYKAGANKNGEITANKRRNDNSIKADKDRNLRSSNTNHTCNVFA